RLDVDRPERTDPDRRHVAMCAKEGDRLADGCFWGCRWECDFGLKRAGLGANDTDPLCATCFDSSIERHCLFLPPRLPGQKPPPPESSRTLTYLQRREHGAQRSCDPYCSAKILRCL